MDPADSRQVSPEFLRRTPVLEHRRTLSDQLSSCDFVLPEVKVGTPPREAVDPIGHQRSVDVDDTLQETRPHQKKIFGIHRERSRAEFLRPADFPQEPRFEETACSDGAQFPLEVPPEELLPRESADFVRETVPFRAAHPGVVQHGVRGVDAGWKFEPAQRCEDRFQESRGVVVVEEGVQVPQLPEVFRMVDPADPRVVQAEKIRGEGSAGMVVPHEHFEIRIRLFQDGADGVFQQLRLVVGRDTDREHGLSGPGHPVFIARTRIIRSRSPFHRKREISTSRNSSRDRIARTFGTV